jgi:hypothetical protein
MSGNRPSGSATSIPFRNNVLFCISGMRSFNGRVEETHLLGIVCWWGFEFAEVFDDIVD